MHELSIKCYDISTKRGKGYEKYCIDLWSWYV